MCITLIWLRTFSFHTQAAKPHQQVCQVWCPKGASMPVVWRCFELFWPWADWLQLGCYVLFWGRKTTLKTTQTCQAPNQLAFQQGHFNIYIYIYNIFHLSKHHIKTTHLPLSLIKHSASFFRSIGPAKMEHRLEELPNSRRLEHDIELPSKVVNWNHLEIERSSFTQPFLKIVILRYSSLANSSLY